jgi:hypothetical protein
MCYTLLYMSPTEQTAFRLDTELMDGLRAVKERDGIPISEQVRRAVKAWLESRGVMKADRKRALTRKRP